MSHVIRWVRFIHLKSKSIVRIAEFNNKNIYVLQIGAALFYYKLGQTFLQTGAASLL